MGIQVQNISELATDDIVAAQELITQLVAEENASVDIKRGVIHDLVLHLSALLGAAKAKEINRLRNSMSLDRILVDPALADSDIVDSVLSNYRVTRRAGSFAFGDVTIVVTGNSPLTLSLDSRFVIEGVSFMLNAGGGAISVRNSSAQMDSDTDRLLVQQSGSLWAFSVPVIAVSVGLIAEIKRGAATTVSPTLLNFSSAHASNDFSAGADTETNDQLLARFQEGVSGKSWSNRATIAAMIQDQPEFEAIYGLSIIGMSDAEMQRDQHSILPISLGGRSDIYIRSAQTAATATHTITATYIETEEFGSIWQFNVGRDVAPGFYEVSRVALTTGSNAADTGYEIVGDARGFDFGTDTYAPDIEMAHEAVYSRYQTAIIQFLDTDTDVSALTALVSTQDYEVTFRYMPLTAELQEFLGGREVRHPAGDVLVKGGVPAFMSVNFTIKKPAQAPEPDLDAIKRAVSLEVNGLEFEKAIHASQIADVVHGHLSTTEAVADMDMLIRVQTPTLENIYVRSGDVLTIPDEALMLTTSRTVVLLLEVADIGITVENI
jgi:hypothetical protein